MADQSRSASPLQATKFLTAAAAVAPLLVLSGLTLTGTVMALIVATPFLVLISPVLVPAGIVVFLVISGLLFSGVLGVAAVMTLLWINNYVAGKQPPGADKVDYARERIAEMVKEYQQQQQKAQADVTPTQGF